MNAFNIVDEGLVIKRPFTDHESGSFPIAERMRMNNANLSRVFAEDDIPAEKAMVIQIIAHKLLNLGRRAGGIGIFDFPPRGLAIVAHTEVWNAFREEVFMAYCHSRRAGGLEGFHKAAPNGGFSHTRPMSRLWRHPTAVAQSF